MTESNRLPKVCFGLVLGLLPAAAIAQSKAELKKELQAREATALDAEALMQLADWAKTKELLSDQKRLLNKVLKLQPEHEGAMKALGYVLFEGKWTEESKAQQLQQRKEEELLRQKGMEKVDSVWVDKAEVADAQKGIYHHEGEVVAREDKIAFVAGKVRHPTTGELIAADDLEKANAALFPAEGGKWVTAAEADSYHADIRHPWAWRTFYGTVLTTLPIEKIDEIKGVVDGSVDTLKPLFGGRMPHPAQRPVIVVCATTDEYRQLGTQIGAEHSTYGAFLAQEGATLENVELRTRPAVANWGGPEGWGPYYVRHAVGLAYVNALLAEHGAQVPYWLVCGVASLAERHYTPEVSRFFGQQHLAKGGVKGLKDWFADFEISADVPTTELDYNVYQAGLLLAFCMNGGDKEATNAVQEFTASLDADKKAIEKAAQKLERVLMSKEEEVRSFLKGVIQKE